MANIVTFAPQRTAGGALLFGAGGLSDIGGTVVLVESGVDVVALAGAVAVAGSLAMVESGADVLLMSGGAGVQAALAAVESGADALSLAGAVAVAGALAALEVGGDSAGLSGAVAVSATVALLEVGSDVLALSGGAGVQVSFAAIESGVDALAASGSLSWGDLNGSMAAAELESDVASFAGTVAFVGLNGTFDAAESAVADVAAMAGYLEPIVVHVTVALAESGADVLEVAGALGDLGGFGAMAAQEFGDDVLSVLGFVVPEVPVVWAPSAVFKDRASAIASLRNDRLLVASAGALPSASMSDSYLWDKLIAAEQDTQRDLGVFFQPTKIIPDDAPQDEIDALNAAGIPFAQEAAYDYEASFFRGDRWGYMVTKQKPIVSVDSVRFVYPSSFNQVFDLPKDWVRLDKHFGHIRIVPTSTGFAAPLAAYILQVLGGGHTVPFMIQIRYTAGLENVSTNWLDLVDVIKKRAVLGIVADAFMPQSGSISADGLSQSMSVDVSKYYEIIDMKMNGPEGSNGGLMRAIHGVRMGVMGMVY